ncbi:fungal trichothecene efflux pump-domain-containing protein [Aspergillus granulosus]|uniref:Fungal trichothecene efflux pump-domain-containing protein n=1 Tax=Aspergillus granulosus TaxID=176169 RepID=A0ABR4H1D9_9EURO
MSAQEKATPPSPEAASTEEIELANSSPKTTLTNLKFVLILIGFGMAFVGSQVQPLLFAAIIPLVSADLDATNLLVWFFTTQLLAIGIISPFAGPLADLFGRKAITLAGVSSAMLGIIICAATPNAAGFLAGQVFAGMGIAIQELMAIAAIVEIVPTSTGRASWRYYACLIVCWDAVTLILIAAVYHPPPRPNAAGLSRIEKLRRIDIPGGILMAAGLVLFLIGFNWGGQAYPWRSARIISFLTVGLALLLVFVAYEICFARHPMFPWCLLTRHTRTFTALMLVILLAGINYVSILMFWVLEAVAVYGSTKTQLGIRTLPYGFCILGGAVISSVMVSLPFFRTRLRSIMTFFCIVQVIGPYPPPLHTSQSRNSSDKTGIDCMASLTPTNLATALAPLVFSLLGVGGVLIPNQLIVTLISPPDLIASATCLTVSLRATYERVVPVALNAKIFDIELLESMMPTLLEIDWKSYARDVLGGVGVTDPNVLQMLHEVIVGTFKSAFDRVWFISIAFGGAAVVASLAIEDLASLVDGSVAVGYF